MKKETQKINFWEHLKIKDAPNDVTFINQSLSSQQKNPSNVKFEGFYKIFDDKNNLVQQGKNAINYENMSIAIANCLGGITTSQIYSLAFGNGGSTVSGTGAITYLPPNTSSRSAKLYNQTYEKSGLTASIATTSTSYDADNTIIINHTAGNTYTDMVIVCTLGFDEPSDQAAFDTTNLTDSYTFDEMAVVTQDGYLLTHAIFAPTAKALNVSLRIEYTIRIKTA